MKTEDFDYPLSEELIAYHSLKNRDECRLMVLNRKDKTIQHKSFYQLPDFLEPGDFIVLNDTKVIPARLIAKSTNGRRYEVLLVERIDSKNWKCLVKNPRDGIVLSFDNGVSGRLRKIENEEWLMEFDLMAEQIIDRYGKMPLPPYIRRESEEEDKVYYQTVFARIDGAIAAPTAGLHFTEELLKAIRRKGVEVNFITLHVGVGTFKPVKVERVENHIMDAEYYKIDESTAMSINRAKVEGRRVIAVGTTVVRALESSCDGSNGIKPISGHTDLFIFPGFNFRVVDALITNFHLPHSTLLMLVSAFAGKDFILDSYRIAMEERYRFLSYGDGMLIL